MTTILLTGGAGYIGSHVCIELINKGYQVVIVDNFSNSSVNSLNNIKNITGYEPIFYESDLRDKSTLKKIFNKYSIDSVMHFAGHKSVNESLKKPILYFDNNLSGTISLLKTMEEFNCNSIVFSSSATVYGHSNNAPIKENHPLEASNPYGQSKLMIERLLNDLYISNKNWNITILRYFNPAGAHESGLIGESPNGTPNNLFPYLAMVASRKINKLSIFGDDYDTHDGTGVRDYIHVVDLAKGHIKALENMQKSTKKISTFNLGTGCGYSVLEVLKQYEIASGKIIQYEFVGRREGDVSKCYADVTLAKKILDWEAEYNLAKMCFDSWKWHKISNHIN